MSSQRIKRLSDIVQRELADLIRYDLKDPRLTGMVTVVAVKLSPDLGYADAYVTVMEKELEESKESKDRHQQSVDILNQAASFLRQELGRRMKTRTVPRIRFHYDTITQYGNYMNELIAKANATSIEDQESK